MPLYVRFVQEAIANWSHQPAREAKIRGIRRQAKSQIVTGNGGVSSLSLAERQARTVFDSPGPIFTVGEQNASDLTSRIWRHGRKRCQEMLNRPLPYVVAYDPATDPDWPS